MGSAGDSVYNGFGNVALCEGFQRHHQNISNNHRNHPIIIDAFDNSIPSGTKCSRDSNKGPEADCTKVEAELQNGRDIMHGSAPSYDKSFNKQIVVESYDNNDSNNHILSESNNKSAFDQHCPYVTIPLGWKRFLSDGSIIYISPSNAALNSLEQVKAYLLTQGTCKCGLECPLRCDLVFNFNPQVFGKLNNEAVKSKPCNHQRKICPRNRVLAPNDPAFTNQPLQQQEQQQQQQQQDIKKDSPFFQGKCRSNKYKLSCNKYAFDDRIIIKRKKMFSPPPFETFAYDQQLAARQSQRQQQQLQPHQPVMMAQQNNSCDISTKEPVPSHMENPNYMQQPQPQLQSQPQVMNPMLRVKPQPYLNSAYSDPPNDQQYYGSGAKSEQNVNPYAPSSYDNYSQQGNGFNGGGGNYHQQNPYCEAGQGCDCGQDHGDMRREQKMSYLDQGFADEDAQYYNNDMMFSPHQQQQGQHQQQQGQHQHEHQQHQHQQYNMQQGKQCSQHRCRVEDNEYCDSYQFDKEVQDVQDVQMMPQQRYMGAMNQLNQIHQQIQQIGDHGQHNGYQMWQQGGQKECLEGTFIPHDWSEEAPKKRVKNVSKSPVGQKKMKSMGPQQLQRNAPSFMEDPSGYMAQQQALVNSTIAKQTGEGCEDRKPLLNQLPEKVEDGKHNSPARTPDSSADQKMTMAGERVSSSSYDNREGCRESRSPIQGGTVSTSHQSPIHAGMASPNKTRENKTPETCNIVPGPGPPSVVPVRTMTTRSQNKIPGSPQQSKSPLEMVQNVVSSIQVSGRTAVSTAAERVEPAKTPQFFVSNGQLLVASSSANSGKATTPTFSVAGSVSSAATVIPTVAAAQPVLNQQTAVLVNTLPNGQLVFQPSNVVMDNNCNGTSQTLASQGKGPRRRPGRKRETPPEPTPSTAPQPTPAALPPQRQQMILQNGNIVLQQQQQTFAQPQMVQTLILPNGKSAQLGQQLITANVLQPLNLVPNYPTIQQYIVPSSFVMANNDGTATILPEGMQLNVLTSGNSIPGATVFATQGQTQSILSPGMVLRTQPSQANVLRPQGGQFLSPNQFIVNNGGQPIVASVSPNQQIQYATARGQGQEYIQCGQTLIPCSMAQRTSPNTTVLQNTTIVQRQMTMVSNENGQSNGQQPVQLSNPLQGKQNFIIATAADKPTTSSFILSPKEKPGGAHFILNSGQVSSGDGKSFIIPADKMGNFILANAGSGDKNARVIIAQDGRFKQTSQQQGQQQQVLLVATNNGFSQAYSGSPPDTTTHSPIGSNDPGTPSSIGTDDASPTSTVDASQQGHGRQAMVHCVSSSNTNDWVDVAEEKKILS